MQVKEVKVKFSENGKEYSFDCSDVFVKLDDKVIVETVRGLEMGTICSRVQVKEVDDNEPLKKIIRLATSKDFQIKQDNKEKENEIISESEKMVSELHLDMKIVNAEISLDSSKVLISFTADERVDFRELIKQMASKFKMRIELRQIDAREETRIIGGLGPCGKECCCKQFLNGFEHSSIKMAKTQGLSLNPSNISGLCGKLKCCLSYENEYYSETYKLMPKINTEIVTPDGKGLVVYNNLLKQIVSVKFINPDGSQNIKEYALEQLKNSRENKND